MLPLACGVDSMPCLLLLFLLCILDCMACGVDRLSMCCVLLLCSTVDCALRRGDSKVDDAKEDEDRRAVVEHEMDDVDDEEDDV